MLRAPGPASSPLRSRAFAAACALACCAQRSAPAVDPRAPAPNPRGAPLPSALPAARTGGVMSPSDPGVTVALERDPAWRALAPGLTARRARVRLEDGTVNEWRVLRLALAQVALTAARAPNERVRDAASDPRALAAIDGGFFDSAHRPAGTLVSEGVEWAPWAPRGGSGVLVVREQRAALLAAGTVFPTAGTELAVQCGPRLIEAGGAVGIYRDDGERYARTAACLREGGRTLDLVVAYLPAAPLRGPGLLAFARALARPAPVDDGPAAAGCELALNLDGGPSTGLWVRGDEALSHDAVGPTPLLLVARAR